MRVNNILGSTRKNTYMQEHNKALSRLHYIKFKKRESEVVKSLGNIENIEGGGVIEGFKFLGGLLVNAVKMLKEKCLSRYYLYK